MAVRARLSAPKEAPKSWPWHHAKWGEVKTSIFWGGGSAASHPGAECAPQVVKPHILDASFFADGVPCPLGFDEMPFRSCAREHEWTVGGGRVCLAFREDFQRLRE